MSNYIKNIRKTSLEAVVGRVLTMLPDDAISEDQVLEWAYEAYESIAPREVYEVDVALKQVVNHVAELPHGVFNLELVMYQVMNPDANHMSHADYTNTTTECETTTDINTGCTSTTTTTSTITTEHPVYPMGYHGSTYNSVNGSLTQKYTYFNDIVRVNRWRPLIPSGNVLHNALLIDAPSEFYQGCTETFSVKGNCIVTSFPEGLIALAYTGLPKDDNGEYMIPDYEYVLKALETHCLKRYWQWKMNMREDGAMNLYRGYAQECEYLLPKATAELMKPNVLEYQRYRNMNKFIKEDSPVATMLGALNNKEVLRFREYGYRYNHIMSLYKLGL